MTYVVRNSKGETIAVASRQSDAQAMAQTVGNESPKKVDKETQ